VQVGDLEWGYKTIHHLKTSPDWKDNMQKLIQEQGKNVDRATSKAFEQYYAAGGDRSFGQSRTDTKLEALDKGKIEKATMAWWFWYFAQFAGIDVEDRWPGRDFLHQSLAVRKLGYDGSLETGLGAVVRGLNRWFARAPGMSMVEVNDFFDVLVLMSVGPGKTFVSSDKKWVMCCDGALLTAEYIASHGV
jgi:hypothetical protein